MENARQIFSGVTFCKDPYAVAKGCDCLLLLTEWKEFRDLNFKKIHQAMRQRIIFDGRNLYGKHDLGALGFEYYGIGRGNL